MEENLSLKIKILNQHILKFVCKRSNNSNEFKKLTPIQARIIKYMASNREKTIYQCDLEKYLKVSRATLSDVLKTMEKNNIIKRAVASNDARKREIILTEKSKEFHEKVNSSLNEINAILEKNLNEEELKNFSNIIDIMINNLEEEEK